MIKTWLFDEPNLYFGNNNKCLDPQVGLLNFGPHGGFGRDDFTNFTINTGIIGTERSINATKLFLKYLKNRIVAEVKSDTQYKGIDFPGLGLKGPLKFDIEIDENCVILIDRKFVRSLKSVQSRKKRITLVTEKYCEELDDIKEAHPSPQIILFPIDDDILSYCKEPGRKIDKIVYQKRDFGDIQSIGAPLFDFHNYLKAQAGMRGFVTQMLLPSTLTFSEKKQNAANIAWNFSVASYYKATGVPWKLSDIDDETCYIGISFYRDISNYRKTMRASIAQVYMRTGESQVITTRPFDWDENKKGKIVHLDDTQMRDLIHDSLELFTRQRRKQPRRLVVHKTTRFSDSEIEGCIEAGNNIDEIDIVHILDRTKFRAYHDKHKYPAVRGMAIGDKNEVMLYTTGFIPVLGTYPGPTAPRPIHIKSQQLDTSIEMISQDILGLSKLDWNTSLFCTRLPVTIGVSRTVGAVMAELVAGGATPPLSYRYYM